VIEALRNSISAYECAAVRFEQCLRSSLLNVLTKYYVLNDAAGSFHSDDLKVDIQFRDSRVVCPEFHKFVPRAGVVGSKLDCKIPVKWFVESGYSQATGGAGEGNGVDMVMVDTSAIASERTYLLRDDASSEGRRITEAQAQRRFCLVQVLVDTGGVRPGDVKIDVMDDALILRVDKYLADRQQVNQFTEEVELPFRVSNTEHDLQFTRDNIWFDASRNVLTVPVVIGLPKARFQTEVERFKHLDTHRPLTVSSHLWPASQLRMSVSVLEEA